jgi:hypothetical protein
MTTPPQPRLTYSEAERVGLVLRRRWYALTGKRRRPVMSSEQWTDFVQAVLRHAGDEIAAREGEKL